MYLGICVCTDIYPKRHPSTHPNTHICTHTHTVHIQRIYIPKPFNKAPFSVSGGNNSSPICFYQL